MLLVNKYTIFIHLWATAMQSPYMQAWNIMLDWLLKGHRQVLQIDTHLRHPLQAEYFRDVVSRCYMW